MTVPSTLTIEFDDPEKCKHIMISLILVHHIGKASSESW